MTESKWQERWPASPLTWLPAYRVVPTRFPAVNLFDRVASPEDFDALYALEAMTNDRLRTEVGELDLVPRDERRFGPGWGPIMAAFTHLNPLGSRFSDGTYGVFYCAASRATAIAETRYHSALFLSATQEPPLRQQMRLYTVLAEGDVVDLRNGARTVTGAVSVGSTRAECPESTERMPDTLARFDPAVLSASDYTAGQALGRAVRAASAPGIVYPSVRDPAGECLAAFRTTLLRDCHHAAYLEYNWNGSKIDVVFELNQVG
ncbi:RES family NAD+ phosphorylase [Paraburkholderia rhizosphaerae]|uniref:RES domain-containing protein n=1 Tax=Paraburkholderia rhizosphaerae TaxID=480658 RepID=A0A4R8LZ28_9BURK|nr:RES family NAD+ phosphorylase [Paraburkholderia rhizosphaerae]TDY53888.1 RES domain-containing protein [Paraburkholderia rhizosphaerae]